jgi:hypothetical protein
MSIHESSVNFQNLIRDLAEMYPFDISEVVVVELIANSLDAKATRILIFYDPQKKILVVQDNGEGMTASQFDEYHDFAAGLKTRGTGIGFAGLGAKVSFNIADRVITETRSKSLSIGSNWYLQSKKKLVWEDIKAENIQETGTRVEVRFRPDARPPFKSTEDLLKLLRRYYLPLLDSKFLDLYESMGLYSSNFRFIVNGNIVDPIRIDEEFSLDKVKEFFPQRRNKRFGYGILGIAESEYPIAPDLCGILLCTYGKVIKVDLFNQFPGRLGPQLFGIIEVPELVNFLTTSKTDFIRKGKYREFERLYAPIRQEFKEWLSSIGVEPSGIIDSDEATEIEREIKKLVEDIPELSDFFGFHMKKDVLKKDEKGSVSSTTQEGIDLTFPVGEGEKGKGLGIVDVGDEPGQATVEDKEDKERAKPISRKARRGPKITFDNRAERMDLAWIEGNNVVINSGHPAHTKAHSNQKTRRLHNLFAVASAIQRFLGSESEKPDLMFIDRLMAAWGRK